MYSLKVPGLKRLPGVIYSIFSLGVSSAFLMRSLSCRLVVEQTRCDRAEHKKLPLLIRRKKHKPPLSSRLDIQIPHPRKPTPRVLEVFIRNITVVILGIDVVVEPPEFRLINRRQSCRDIRT